MENKIFYLPDNFEKVVSIPGKGVILRVSTDYCRSETKGGIILPDTGDDNENSYEKKFEIGRAIAVGPECVAITKGDVVIFQKSTAFRLPDGDAGGNSSARYRRIDENSASVIAILPPDPDEDDAGEEGS